MSDAVVVLVAFSVMVVASLVLARKDERTRQERRTSGGAAGYLASGVPERPGLAPGRHRSQTREGRRRQPASL